MKRGLHFVPIFLLFLLLIGIGVFATFTIYARSEVVLRRKLSSTNLEAISAALKAYVLDPGNGREFPPELTALPEYQIQKKIFLNPSWPDQPGYVYVSGVKPADDPRETILVYENVPSEKEKIGRFVLTLNGTVRLWKQEDRFDEHLKAQEEAWKSKGRRWRLAPVSPGS